MMANGQNINRRGKYWESVLPIVAETDQLFLKPSREAGTCQINRKRKDRDSGEARHGKIVTCVGGFWKEWALW